MTYYKLVHNDKKERESYDITATEGKRKSLQFISR